MAIGDATGASPLVGRYPGWRTNPCVLPEGDGLQWHVRKSRGRREATSSVVPLRGQRSFGSGRVAVSFCFPFNCAGVNTGTGTNGRGL